VAPPGKRQLVFPLLRTKTAFFKPNEKSTAQTAFFHLEMIWCVRHSAAKCTPDVNIH